MRRPLLLFTAITLLSASSIIAQVGFSVGFHGATVKQPVHSDWAAATSVYYSMIEPYTIPDYTKGYFVGIEWRAYDNPFVTTAGFVYNGATTDALYNDVYGNSIPTKLKLRYNHLEGGMFWYPMNGMIGLGGTTDVGYAKLLKITEESKTSFAKNIELGHKLAIRLRTRGEKFGLSLMAYYQFVYFKHIVYGNNIDAYDLRPIQIGLRLGLRIGG